MRRIRLQPPNNQKWQRWLKACAKETQELEKVVARGNKPEFKETLYKRRKEFFFGNDSLFYGKCAYCECYIKGFQHGDVEHFRPKGGVTDELDREITHLGYYWLAYDWQNLLPACIACNQPTSVNDRKIGKHNRFPVIGIHAQTPAEIINEQPLLINPASENDDDDPAKHLEIDVDTGLLIGLTERGRMSIEIFGLNVRDRLLEERRRAIRDIKALLSELIYERDNQKNLENLALLKGISQGKYSYSLAQNTILSPFLEKISQIRS